MHEPFACGLTQFSRATQRIISTYYLTQLIILWTALSIGQSYSAPRGGRLPGPSQVVTFQIPTIIMATAVCVARTEMIIINKIPRLLALHMYVEYLL